MDFHRLILIYCYPFAAVLCLTLPLKGIVRFELYGGCGSSCRQGRDGFIVVELSQGLRVVLLPGPADWAVTAFAKEFKMRNAAAFSAMSIFKVNREPLFIRLLHLQSGLCHCRVDADVLFVPLGL
ncbi:hypothetical protein T09_1156 [Trichinella sp. T9]|nr:hypothetical protein T09_1156 [Trichinella sp. T9]